MCPTHDPCGAERAEGASGQLLSQGNDHDLQWLSFNALLALPMGDRASVAVTVGILPILDCHLDCHLARITERVFEDRRP